MTHVQKYVKISGFDKYFDGFLASELFVIKQFILSLYLILGGILPLLGVIAAIKTPIGVLIQPYKYIVMCYFWKGYLSCNNK